MPPSFIEYASSPNLSEDEIYTIELLIERVRKREHFTPEDWKERDRRSDARRLPDYQPSYSIDHVAQAADELLKLEWLSFQQVAKTGRAVRDVRALRYTPHLNGLILDSNKVEDISAIAHCEALRRLSLARNPVRNLAPLRACLELRELDVSDAPIEDFSPLQDLPKLHTLEITSDQLPALCQIPVLPSIRKLEMGGEAFSSF